MFDHFWDFDSSVKDGAPRQKQRSRDLTCFVDLVRGSLGFLY
jgi:hypothetical protein